MSRRVGRGLSSKVKWKIIQAPDDEWSMLGRALPQNEAKSALVAGLYSDGMVIQIEAGKWRGNWKVRGTSLVNVSTPEKQIHFDRHAKETPSKQLVLL